MEDEDVLEHRRDVTAVAWRSDGRFLAVATIDYIGYGTWVNGRVEITDTASNAEAVTIELPDDWAASTIHWLPDSSGFVVGLESGVLQVYDFPAYRLRNSFTSRIGAERSTMVSLSPDGRYAASAAEYYNPFRDERFVGDDSTVAVRVFDIATGVPIATSSYTRSLEEFPRWVSWNPDGTTVSLLDTAGKLFIWDFAPGSLNLRRQIETGIHGPIVGGAYNAMGDAVALFGYRADFVAILDIGTGQTIRKLENSSGVRGIHWNWATNQIAGVSGDGMTRSGLVYIWNADTGSLIQTFSYPETMTEQVAWSAGGALAIATSGIIGAENASSGNIDIVDPPPEHESDDSDASMPSRKVPSPRRTRRLGEGIEG